MSGQEEIDFDQAKPLKLVAEVNAEKTVNFFKGDTDNPLQMKDVDEAWMADFSEMLQDLDQLSKLVEMKKIDLKRIANGAEMLQRGKYVGMFKTTKGRTTFDRDRFIKDKIGKPTEQDLREYSSQGEPVIRFEGIRKLE
jgi:hypothetical protein